MTNFNPKLEKYWNDIPVGHEHPITYSELRYLWGGDERSVRRILQELSAFDNGDNYILVRSGAGKGFYKTDNIEAIQAYKHECLNKGRSFFAPVKKMNRVLTNNGRQLTLDNNLRVVRETKGFTQTAVCEYLHKYDKAVDPPMLSKMENGVCLPTPIQLAALAQLFECESDELINTEGSIYG